MIIIRILADARWPFLIQVSYQERHYDVQCRIEGGEALPCRPIFTSAGEKFRIVRPLDLPGPEGTWTPPRLSSRQE